MRMNRRAFSLVPTASAPPAVGEYSVILFSLTTGEDYASGAWPNGVYGRYAPGTTVIVDLEDDYNVNSIDKVEPYDTNVGATIDDVAFEGSFAVRFTMPAFDVAVLIETNYQ